MRRPSVLRCWPLQCRPRFYDCRRWFEPQLEKVLSQKLYWRPGVVSMWTPSVKISVHPWFETARLRLVHPTGLSKAGGVSTVLWCKHRKDHLGSIEKIRGLYPIAGFRHMFVSQTGLRITVMATDWKRLEFAQYKGEMKRYKNTRHSFIHSPHWNIFIIIPYFLIT